MQRLVKASCISARGVLSPERDVYVQGSWRRGTGGYWLLGEGVLQWCNHQLVNRACLGKNSPSMLKCGRPRVKQKQKQKQKPLYFLNQRQSSFENLCPPCMVLQIENTKAFIRKENQTPYFSLVSLNEPLKALRRETKQIGFQLSGH